MSEADDSKKRLEIARSFLVRISKISSLTTAKSLANQALRETSQVPWKFKSTEYGTSNTPVEESPTSKNRFDL